MIPALSDLGPPPSPAPVGPFTAQAQEEIRRIQESVKKAKIMMVDDEIVNLMAIEKNLRRTGYQNFVNLTDSSLAMKRLDDEKPDLLLLDIMMPVVNGLDILRQIRTQSTYQCLPVIILTAYCDPETRREALAAGCTDFLAKPVDPNELGLRVRNVLVAKSFYDHVSQRAKHLEAQISIQANELASAQREAQLKYLAGKAEIATDVLHNVGNALNSVNVGVNMISFTMRDSKIKSLKRAVDLLLEQGRNLASFLTKEERGRVIPSYLKELTDALLAERERILSELDLLAKHVEHINAVVSTQQKYAKVCQVLEEIQLHELMMDVEELLGGSLAKSGISVVREYDKAAVVRSDRQRLLQVMLNLVKNSIDAIRQAHTGGSGCITMRVADRGKAGAAISVTDNGIGIAAENLIKVFSHGFTTKKEGHGFGLHSCGNIMKELGGTITAHSDGPGRGATFTLEIPYRSQER